MRVRERVGKFLDWFTADRLLRMLIFVLIISLLLTQVNAAINRSVSNGNRKILKAIEEQTSPERLREQKAAVTALISQIDCNTQATLQRTIDVLVERGVLDAGDVRVLKEECQAREITTTTTAPTTTTTAH